MKNINFSRHLGAVSALALTAATFASVQPAAAAQGVYGGGASLVSLLFRSLADCYHGVTPTGAPASTAACTTAGRPNSNVALYYASVGSSAGRRAFLSNDSRQLVNGTAAASPTPLSLPTATPVYVDTTGFVPGVYPYPALDFGSSEAPHSTTVPTPVTPYTGFSPASGWESLAPPPATPITAQLGAATTYNTAKSGKIVQLPFTEVGVGIGVNAPRPNIAPWQIAYQTTFNPMHLSQAQICAIFSATVTDWSDSTTTIAYRDAANVLQSETFAAGNTPGGNPYTTSSLPMKVVYRSDGSGTTFIMLNFLNAVCPFLDDGANKYTQIFAAPTDKFSDLIARINTAFPARSSITGAWIGAQGNAGVAAGISNKTADPAFTGRIGYVSNDFQKQYSTAANAPFVAAVQNEQQRLAGVAHPSAATPFISPTPNTISKAWLDLNALSTAFNDYTTWNVYAQTHTVYGGLSKSILPTTTRTGAYSISGTGFLSFYSCYADPAGTRVAAITNFMSWLYGASSNTFPAGMPSTTTRAALEYDANVVTVMRAAGFNPIPKSFATRIFNGYIAPTSSFAIVGKPGPSTKGCFGVTGGGAL